MIATFSSRPSMNCSQIAGRCVMGCTKPARSSTALAFLASDPLAMHSEASRSSGGFTITG